MSELWSHILERSLLHLGWAPWVMGLSVYGFYLLGIFRPPWRLVGRWRWALPGIVALLFIFLREPSDVARGGWLGKSYIDFAVWASSLTFAGLGLRWYARHFPED